MTHRTIRIVALIAAAVTGLGLAAAAFQPVAASSQPTATDRAASTPAILSTQDISLAQAEAILQAAKAKAQELNTKMDIAVVDAGGNLKAFARMDGAWLGSIDIAMKKARTARWFDMDTGKIGGLSQPGGPLYGIEHSNGGLITFPGGVPIKAPDGSVIGAVGVSGSTVENDHTVAAAGAAAATGPTSGRRP